MKTFMYWLILLVSISGIAMANDDKLTTILDGIDNAQQKIQNLEASFIITPLATPGEETYSTPTLAGNYKIEVPEWLWTRGKAKTIVRYYLANKEYLKKTNHIEPYLTKYYAFNGRESLRFDEEYVERGLEGYLIMERDPHGGLCCIFNPAWLWFKFMDYPTFLLIDGFKKRTKRFSIQILRYEGEVFVDNHLCDVIYCEFKCICGPPNATYDIDYLKIWVDSQYNYVFRKMESGNVYNLNKGPQLFDGRIIDKIKVKEVMPGFFLPVSARGFRYKKKENGKREFFNGQRIDITYKGINIPVKDGDFWFPIRKDRLIYNSLLGVGGKDFEEYQSKVESFKKQF